MVFEKLFHAATAVASTPATTAGTSSTKKKTKKNDIHPSISTKTTKIERNKNDIQGQRHEPNNHLSKDEKKSNTFDNNNNNNNSSSKRKSNSTITSTTGSNDKKKQNTNELNLNKTNTPISRSQKRKRNQNSTNNISEQQQQQQQQPTTYNSPTVRGGDRRTHNDKAIDNKSNNNNNNNKNSSSSSSSNNNQHNRNQSHRQDQDRNFNNTSNRHKERTANSTSNNNINHNNNNNQKQRRQFVSPLAIELSIALKDLSQQKKLQELLSLYWNKTSATNNTTTIDINKYSTAIRDNHHACVVIDCCSRCGDMPSAERIYDQLVYNNNKQNNNGSTNNSSSSDNNNNGSSSSNISIEIYTALLKGYAHSGNVVKMMKLFSSLNTTTPNVRTINTVLRGCLWTPAIGNTNDSSSCSNSDSSKQKHCRMIVGGVISSEHLWQKYQWKQKQEQEQQIQLSISSFFDVSSYEYSISLLCQALCTTVAQERINDFQKLYNVTIRGKATVVLLPTTTTTTTNDTNDNENNSSILEVIAICYLALGRAYSIVGDDTSMWIAVQRSLSAVRSSRTLLSESTQAAVSAVTTTNSNNNNNNSSVSHTGHDVTTVQSKHKKQKKNDTMAVGGKRSWKNSTTTESDQQQQHQQYDQSTTTRFNSNYAYRIHRLSEIESDAMFLIKSRTTIKNLNQTNVVTCYINNLLCFNGGGSTSVLPVVNNKNTNNNNNSSTTINDNNKNSSKSNNLNQSEDTGVLIPTIYSFGLAKLAKVEIFESANEVIPDMEDIIKKVSSMYNVQCQSPIDTNGCLQLDKIYNDNKLPLDIELGAGFGSWIVNQAQNNSNRNYLAIELRSDRVYQILARAIIQFHGKLNNLCIVGCDSYSFFHRRRVSNQSVSTIFINHPEPPTQTYGDNIKQLQLISTIESNTEANNNQNSNNNEPSHMLHSSTIIEMIPCLKVDGKIVIVTDNKSYVRLLAATFSKVILLQQQQQQQNEHKNQQKKQQLKVKNCKVYIRSMKINEVNNFNTTLRLLETFGGNVNIFQGEQHPVTSNIVPTTTTTTTLEGNSNTVVGTSYFDRLWRTGVSSHSERLNRFILVFIREK